MNQIPEGARGYEGFGGTIGRTVRESRSWWPPTTRAPEGAPNVVVVLVDDMGFGDIAPFGAEVDTPNLDRLAGHGYRLTNYHTAPVCTPARAALLTGLNPHRAGYASLANGDPGFPGHTFEIADDVLTLPEILRENGYATFAVGKWHLTRDALMNAGAPVGSWPVQRGFDRYYGCLEGFESFFHPHGLYRDNTPVDVDEFPDDYYLTDDLTDRAIEMITALRTSDAARPFFLYFAHNAVHGPLGAKPQDLAKQGGRYDEGWDRLRERRFARQVAEGLFPPDTVLPDGDDELGMSVPAWDDVPAEQQQLLARYMEVYAAMVDSIDQSLGRIMSTLEELGELDNTIIVFTSDNGGTAEGGAFGTRSYFSQFIHLGRLPDDWIRDYERDLDLVGGPQSMIHYPLGWARASNTPFRLYKGHTFAGGVRVPFLVSWPAGLPRQRGDDGIRREYQYVTDLLPTLLELTGTTAPGTRAGQGVKDVDGVSMTSVLASAGIASQHVEQYSEFMGNRGFYRDGWKILTEHPRGAPYELSEWKLFHIATDPTETRDRAAEHPEKVAELAEAWERAAWANTVFPLADGSPYLNVARRPEEAELSRPVTILPGTPTLERYRSSRLTQHRSFEIDVSVEHPDGATGVLVSHGDQGGGYALYVLDGGLVLAYNEYGRMHRVSAGSLPGGTHEITLSASAEPDFRWDWTVVVDGRRTASLPGVAQLMFFAPFTGISVGLDRGGPVDWDVYEKRGAYPYTGRLRKVVYRPGELAPYSPAAVLEAALAAAEIYD